MASESGSVNPANLYVGVVELFSILLPGAILTFLLCWTPFLSKHIVATEFTHNRPPDIPGIRAIAFAVVSYVTGHFLRALGYFVMVPLFEDYHARSLEKRRRSTAEPINQPPPAATRLKTKINDIVGAENSPEERFRWSMAYLSYYSPQATARLDSLDAACKFFRNLTPTLVLSFPLIDSMYDPCGHRPAWELFIIVLFLLYVAIWNRVFPTTGKRPFDRPSKSLAALLVLWVAPLVASIVPTGQIPIGKTSWWSWSHLYVNLGLYLLMLFAGIRYLALQGDLRTLADKFLVVLFSKRPEAVGSGGDKH